MRHPFAKEREASDSGKEVTGGRDSESEADLGYLAYSGPSSISQPLTIRTQEKLMSGIGVRLQEVSSLSCMPRNICCPLICGPKCSALIFNAAQPVLEPCLACGRPIPLPKARSHERIVFRPPRNICGLVHMTYDNKTC